MSNKNKQNDNKNFNNRGILTVLAVALLSMFLFSQLNNQVKQSTNKEISYNEFLEMIDDGKVEKVVETTDRYEIYPKGYDEDDFTSVSYYTGLVEDPDLTQKLIVAKVDYSAKVPESSNALVDFLFVWILPFVLIYVVMYFLFRSISKSSGGGGLGGIGKSKAKVYVQKETGVSFKDVAGQNEAKESLIEIVDFLHNPGKYTRIWILRSFCRFIILRTT